MFNEEGLLFKDKVNFKLPNSRPDLLHQDHSAGWGKYSKNYFITMLITVDKNTIENAAVKFLNDGKYERKLIKNEWEPLEKSGQKRLINKTILYLMNLVMWFF